MENQKTKQEGESNSIRRDEEIRQLERMARDSISDWGSDGRESAELYYERRDWLIYNEQYKDSDYRD
jgi:hypothetical protein